MCTLILECGMVTESWYAELALRRRVSMSATGSVIVMAWWPASPRFPCGPAAWSVGAGGAQVGLSALAVRPRALAPGVIGRLRLPAGLGDARKLAAVRHRPEADPAQAEPAAVSYTHLRAHETRHD